MVLAGHVTPPLMFVVVLRLFVPLLPSLTGRLTLPCPLQPLSLSPPLIVQIQLNAAWMAAPGRLALRPGRIPAYLFLPILLRSGLLKLVAAILLIIMIGI